MKFVLVTGLPGAGKTTAIKQILGATTLTDTMYSGRDFAAMPPDKVVGTRHLHNGKTITAIGDFRLDANAWLGGGDVFYRLNNSRRTPWDSFDKKTLLQALMQVVTALPADTYVYDNWKPPLNLLQHLKQTFDLRVLYLDTPPEVARERRIARLEQRSRRNGHFNPDPEYLTSNPLPAYYGKAGITLLTCTARQIEKELLK